MTSYKEDVDRVDQIVRVDATALLKTIRELEYKLTEHQKAEKQPAWAVALEQRLEQLENTFYQSQAKHGSFRGNDLLKPPTSDASDEAPTEAGSPAKSHHEEPSVHTTDHTEHSEQHHEEIKHDPKEKRSVVDMATEMKIIGKVRREIDNKFHTAENHLDTKLSSVNLQMDRLMKLLQIRPTTSELQTVMNAVYDVEKKVTTTMDDIRTDVRATLKSRISEEIVSIIDEVNQSKDLNDNGIKYLRTTVDGFQTEMADLREVTENTVVIMSEQMEGVKKHNNQLEFHVGAMKHNVDRALVEQSALIAELRAEQNTLTQEFQAYKTHTENEAERLSMATMEEKLRLDGEISRLEYALSEAASRVESSERDILGVQMKMDADREVQAAMNKKLAEGLADQLMRIDKLRRDVDALTSADYAAQIKVLQEELRKSNEAIVANAETIDKYVNGDLKTLNVKVSLLQEQCNIQIPNAYGEMAMRIDGLNEHLQQSNSVLDKLQVRLQSTDETVGELMPLLDRTTALETHSKDHTHEVSSIKDSLTNTIDTTDELIRRMEECEEGIEGMESSVTNRMNQMRDALIDTVLEKQSETNSAMRNVRENLEVMSRAGENSTVSGGGGGMGGGRSGSIKMNTGNTGGGGGMVSSASAGNISSNNSYTSNNSGGGNNAVPSVSTRGAPGSRKNSNANSGTRASISAESGLNMNEDEFSGNNTFANSNYNHNNSVSSGSTGMGGVGGMVGIGGVNFTRPSMIGQELRGTAPPLMSRQSSVTGMGSRQSSIKGGNIHTHNTHGTNNTEQSPMSARSSGINLQMGSPTNQFTSAHNTPNNYSGHTVHHAYNERVDSPEPAEFSSTIHSLPDISAGNVNNSGNYDQHSLSPRVAGVAAKAVAHQQNTYSNHVTPVTHSGGQQGQGMGMGQVKYNPPPEQAAAKYQLQNHHDPGAVSATSNNNSNIEAYHFIPHDYAHFQQAQFLADLCLNFEEISVKRKRVANVPTVMCESIADITQEIAEFMARAADYEMVQFTLASVIGLTSASEVAYDENLVLSKRNTKIEEYLNNMTNLVIMGMKQQNPGMVRLDARSLFLSLVKKSLDMFMSKHNQVLVVGNSRLGRVKIPSCIACDRPLIDKVRLDSVASRGGTRGDSLLTPGPGSGMFGSPPAGNARDHNFHFGSLGNQGSVASFGFNAIENGGSVRGGESDDGEDPASSVASENTRNSSLAPISRKPGSSAQGAARKRSVDKLPEVQ